MSGFLVLVAGAAGSVDDARVATVRDTLGTDATTVRVEDAPGLEQALDSRGDRTLVLMGGDGSLHVLVAALDRRGELAATPLGLVPSGTGNDFARTLGIPEEPEAAARRVVGGRPRALDLVRVDDTIVCNASHAGVGVRAAERAAGLKGRIGPLAYPAGAVSAGMDREAGIDVRVWVDGTEVATDQRHLLVGVGNGRSIGGGTELFPDAEPDDGLLDVVVVGDGPAWERLLVGLSLRKGTHVDLDDDRVEMHRGATVTVRGRSDWNDDGEVGDPVDGREFVVDPLAWQVLC